MNLVRLQYGGGGGELHGASITVNTEETTLVGKEALLYKVSDLSTIINRTVFSALSSEGVSTATFNNIIEPDIYIVKSSDGTDTAETDEIQITAEDIVNKTTTSREVGFAITVNVTVYSAVSDTVYYYIDGNNTTLCTTDTTGIGTASITIKRSSELNLKLYSTVAKDTADYLLPYSQDVNINADTAEIYLMPSETYYWYGYNSDNWTYLGLLHMGRTIAVNNATKNANNIQLAKVADSSTMGSCTLQDIDITNVNTATVYYEISNGNANIASKDITALTGRKCITLETLLSSNGSTSVLYIPFHDATSGTIVNTINMGGYSGENIKWFKVYALWGE